MKKVEPVALTTVPTVSVVIPCYNYGHFLPMAVESIVHQPGVEVDVLIVDDCSTDDSYEVARGLAAQYPEVRVVRNEQNSRLIATANRGLAEVTGTYALLISADDALTPGALERAVAIMEANADVGLVYGAVNYFSTMDLPVIAPAPAAHWVIWDGEDWAGRVFETARGPIASPEAVVRTSTMRDVGDYDPSVPATSDLQMWLRFAAKASIGFVAGTPQAFYRTHGANMSVTQFGRGGDQRHLLDLRYRMDAFESAANGFPDGERFLRAARRQVAAEALELARLALDAPDGRLYYEELVAYAETMDPRNRFTIGWLALRARITMGRAFAAARLDAVLRRAQYHDSYRRDLREAETGLRR